MKLGLFRICRPLPFVNNSLLVPNFLGPFFRLSQVPSKYFLYVEIDPESLSYTKSSYPSPLLHVYRGRICAKKDMKLKPNLHIFGKCPVIVLGPLGLRPCLCLLLRSRGSKTETGTLSDWGRGRRVCVPEWGSPRCPNRLSVSKRAGKQRHIGASDKPYGRVLVFR